MGTIQVMGARIHNLQKINATLPRGKFIVFTGVSGSGKSSLAFDILYEEGRKRYLQSIGLGARGEVIEEHDPFDELVGLPPAIAVEQHKIRQSNPRSIVGTKTKALHDLKWLYALEGRRADGERTNLTPNHFAFYASLAESCDTCEGRGSFAKPDIEKIIEDPNRKVSKIVSAISAQLDKYLMRLERDQIIDWRHAIYSELPEDVQHKVIWGTHSYEGIMNFILGRMRMKPERRARYEQLWYSNTLCSTCGGKRMGERARATLLGGLDMNELCELTMSELSEFFQRLTTAPFAYTAMGRRIIGGLTAVFRLFNEVGLSHLTLLRSIPTLSGGELQRLYLMYHLESKFDSLLYVFDEPTAGLHETEKQSLIRKLKHLTASGNTVIVVEHDSQVIREADYIVELGPGAGKAGGKLVFQGTYEAYMQSKDSVLVPYLSGDQSVLMKHPESYRTIDHTTPKLTLRHANAHNLKDVTVEFPLGVMIGVSGVSGSGKSTLIMDSLVPMLKKKLENGGPEDEDELEDDAVPDLATRESNAASVEGTESIHKCVLVSQKLIGRSRASTPAAYIGIWDKIRAIYAEQPESAARGYTPSHFSFNLEQGQCRSCRGAGAEAVDMGAIGIVNRICASCDGKRYQAEILEIQYNGCSIWNVLEMTPVEALVLFQAHKSITLMLQTLIRVGLDYIALGQPITTISGGEAQRIKLAKELGRSQRRNTLYVLDEPTTGLSGPDIAKLMALLQDLVDHGNTVIVIEHDAAALSYCDWMITMGPGGGSKGGEIVSSGTAATCKLY